HGGRGARLRPEVCAGHPGERRALSAVRGAHGTARHGHRTGGRLRPRRGDLQEGGEARSAHPADPRRGRHPPAGRDRPPPRPAPSRARRTGGLAMTRAIVLLLALVTQGCIIPIGSFSLIGGRRPLEETTVEGKGRAKVLLIDISNVITDTPSRHAFGLVEEESTGGRVDSELKRGDDDSRSKVAWLRII